MLLIERFVRLCFCATVAEDFIDWPGVKIDALLCSKPKKLQQINAIENRLIIGTQGMLLAVRKNESNKLFNLLIWTRVLRYQPSVGRRTRP